MPKPRKNKKGNIPVPIPKILQMPKPAELMQTPTEACSTPKSAKFILPQTSSSEETITRKLTGQDKTTVSDAPQTSRGLKRQNLKLSEIVGELLTPGDEFVIDSDAGKRVILGPGLQIQPREDGDTKHGTVTMAGFLQQRKQGIFYIDLTTHSYIPFQNDDVVGVISKKSGDYYVIDLGIRDRVILSKLAFEGATKKNKPDLKVGDVVFGRILVLPSDYPLEMTCVVPGGRNSGHGPLENGLLFEVPVQVLKTYHMKKQEELLKKMGTILPFELVFGVNGFVWVKSIDDVRTILVSQAIQAVASLSLENHGEFLSAFRSALHSLPPVVTNIYN